MGIEEELKRRYRLPWWKTLDLGAVFTAIVGVGFASASVLLLLFRPERWGDPMGWFSVIFFGMCGYVGIHTTRERMRAFRILDATLAGESPPPFRAPGRPWWAALFFLFMGFLPLMGWVKPGSVPLQMQWVGALGFVMGLAGLLGGLLRGRDRMRFRVVREGMMEMEKKGVVLYRWNDLEAVWVGDVHGNTVALISLQDPEVCLSGARSDPRMDPAAQDKWKNKKRKAMKWTENLYGGHLMLWGWMAGMEAGELVNALSQGRVDPLTRERWPSSEQVVAEFRMKWG